MFLTSEEIIELTGYKQKTSQIKWLRENGVRFLLGGDDRPKILASQIEQLIGPFLNKTKRKAEPNEDALRKFMGISACHE